MKCSAGVNSAVVVKSVAKSSLSRCSCFGHCHPCWEAGGHNERQDPPPGSWLLGRALASQLGSRHGRRGGDEARSRKSPSDSKILSGFSHWCEIEKSKGGFETIAYVRRRDQSLTPAQAPNQDGKLALDLLEVKKMGVATTIRLSQKATSSSPHWKRT